MQAWDKDNSNTISFDEFIDALQGGRKGERRDNKLHTLQSMSSNDLLSMDTLIGIERRKKLAEYIIQQSSARQNEMNDLWKRSDKLSSKKMKQLLHDLELAHTESIEKDDEKIRGM